MMRRGSQVLILLGLLLFIGCGSRDNEPTVLFQKQPEVSGRRNVRLFRTDAGSYEIYGRSGSYVLVLSEEAWSELGLHPIKKGCSALVDLQVSGLPKE